MPPKEVHILIPELVTMSPDMGKGTLKCYEVTHLEMERLPWIIRCPNVIKKILKNGIQRQKKRVRGRKWTYGRSSEGCMCKLHPWLATLRWRKGPWANGQVPPESGKDNEMHSLLEPPERNTDLLTCCCYSSKTLIKLMTCRTIR